MVNAIYQVYFAEKFGLLLRFAEVLLVEILLDISGVAVEAWANLRYGA